MPISLGAHQARVTPATSSAHVHVVVGVAAHRRLPDAEEDAGAELVVGLLVGTRR